MDLKMMRKEDSCSSMSSMSEGSDNEEAATDKASTMVKEADSDFDEPEDAFIWDSQFPHPMCIPHIVDNILYYLEVADLKCSRLINSQYNEMACRNLGSMEVIKFNKMAHLSSYISLMPISIPNNNKQNMGKTTQDIKVDLEEEAAAVEESNKSKANKTVKPETYIMAHTSYHFNFDPEDNDPNVVPQLEKLFDTVGDQINELKYTTDLVPLNFPKRLPHMGDIWKGRLNNLETLIFEIKWGCPPLLYEKEEGAISLPSVKKIVLDMLITERDAERAAVFLQQLFKSTPNVEEISIPGSKKFFDDYINVVLGRIILSLDLPRLSTLNFCLALNPIQLCELAQRKFKLKTLILDFAEVHHFSHMNQNLILERSLEALFEQAAPTLKDLHLCFPFNPEHLLHRFTFPEKMMKLERLALGKFYGSVSILDKLPVIKKLDLWNVQFHDFCGQEAGNCQALFAVPTQYLSITTVIS